MADAEAPVPVSSVLLAVSRQIASACAAQNRAFLDCKRRDRNPEACLKEGDEVTGCVIDLCVSPLINLCSQLLRPFAHSIGDVAHPVGRVHL